MKMKQTLSSLNPKSVLLALSAAGILVSTPALARDSAQLNEQDNQATVVVDEKAPQVQLQQPAPQVSVDQAKAQVEVTSDKPQVSIEQPEPEVTIDQPQPEVNIEQPEPEVVINEAKPQVDVQQAKPEVTIEPAEPEVNVVNLDEQGQEKETKQTTAAQNLMQVKIDQLKDKTVVNAQGQEIGGVEDVVAARQGDEKGLVVSVGGFFGIGDTQIFVPASEAQVEGDKIVWQTQESPDQLEQRSGYDANRFESVSEQYNTLSEVQGAS